MNGRISVQISRQIAALLAVQKFARFPGFQDLCKILSVQNFVQTRENATGPQGVCFLF